MDATDLVNRARSGDVDAFTLLVQRYQTMAFGYALANLGDPHLAEDAVQLAFVTAHRSLSNLQQPERFAAWLRGIVRFECSHLRRGRPVGLVPIHLALDLPETRPGPERIAEDRDGVARILGAIRALPEEERDVTVLYYLRDRSQREVAAFLNLSITTVNNRLRSARRRLKNGDLLAMAKETFKHHSLPDDFAERVGRIVRSHGPLLDARFAPDLRPPVLNALTITDPETGRTSTAEVVQHLADDLVRLIVLDAPGEKPPAFGTDVAVIDATAPVTVPLDLASVRKVVQAVRRAPSTRDMLDTGIKAIDVLCPFPTQGLVGLAGAMQVGKMVLAEELIHRLAGSNARLTLLVFVQAPDEVTLLPRLDYRTSAEVEVIYLPVADTDPAALAAEIDDLDAVISLSRELGKDGLYPAIDAARSSSKLLDPAVAGQAQVDLTEELKAALAMSRTSETAEAVSARRLQRYLTQPFFVAEPFTNRPGLIVSRETAIEDIRALLNGAHESRSANDLYMIGTLDEASPRA